MNIEQNDPIKREILFIFLKNDELEIETYSVLIQLGDVSDLDKNNIVEEIHLSDNQRKLFYPTKII